MQYKRYKKQKLKNTNSGREHKFIIYDEYKGLWMTGFASNRPTFSLAKWKAIRFDNKSKAEQFINNNLMFFDWAKIGKVRR